MLLDTYQATKVFRVGIGYQQFSRKPLADPANLDIFCQKIDHIWKSGHFFGPVAICVRVLVHTKSAFLGPGFAGLAYLYPGSCPKVAKCPPQPLISPIHLQYVNTQKVEPFPSMSSLITKSDNARASSSI